MIQDPWDHPDAKAWAQHVREDMLPKLQSSALAAMLITGGDPDVKLAVELGMSILLDKPVIVMVTAGATVPEHLVRCADEIIEFDSNTPERTVVRLQEAIERLQAKGMLPSV